VFQVDDSQFSTINLGVNQVEIVKTFFQRNEFLANDNASSGDSPGIGPSLNRGAKDDSVNRPGDQQFLAKAFWWKLPTRSLAPYWDNWYAASALAAITGMGLEAASTTEFGVRFLGQIINERIGRSAIILTIIIFLVAFTAMWHSRLRFLIYIAKQNSFVGMIMLLLFLFVFCVVSVFLIRTAATF
jgi:hypothetical protein